MQEQRIEDQTPCDERFSAIDHQRGVLHLLFDDGFPWTVDEIAREISGSHLNAVDAISELASAGLVHRLNEFIFPTRAARRADQIENPEDDA